MTPPPKPTILLVEDDPDQLFLLELAARRSGRFSRIEVALNAEDALHRMDGFPRVPEVVITDLRMPGMDGIGFLEQLRQRSEAAGIHAVILTCAANPSDRARAHNAGCGKYVQKPAEFDRLLDLMAEIAGMPEKSRAVASVAKVG